MSQDVQKNMAVVQHWFSILPTMDKEIARKELRACYTEDYTIHDPGTPNVQPGIENYIPVFDQFLEANRDVRVIVGDMFGVDDKVVTRGFAEYTVIKTNERKRVMALIISRFVDGKIAEEWQILGPEETVVA